MVSPIPGITAENYTETAKAFSIANGGTPYVIDRYQTPRQWGAWMGYFDSRRIKATVFRNLGKGGVPAEFPHLFDADWGKGNDVQAGERHVGTLRDEQRDAGPVVDAAARKMHVKAALGYNPKPGRRQAGELIPSWLETPPRVDISDFPNR